MNAFARRQIMRLYEIATGRRMLTYLNQLNRNQWLSQAELLSRQRQKLHQMLLYAYHHVPYYRHLFDEAGFQPDHGLHDMSSFGRLPTLTRSLIRGNLEALQTMEVARRATLRRLTTSGSTGHPLIYMQDPVTRDYFTAYVHHHLGWSGWQFGQPHAYIGGGGFEASQRSRRDRLMDWTLNRFLTSAYSLSEASMQTFAQKIRRYRPALLYGYASSLYYFAQFVRQNKFEDIKIGSIFTSAEVMYPEQRSFIEETFKGQVYDRYATRELGEIASQCQAQTGMHLSVENVYVEIINDEGQPVQPGEAGQVVVTSLTNYGMPFIRYNMADIAAWYPEESCPCGRGHPMVSALKGRQNDMFRSRDGRLVWGGLSTFLRTIEGIKQFQFIQKSYDLMVVRVVREGGLRPEDQNKVAKIIGTALGQNIEVKFEYPEEIPVEKSGKFRYQICEIEP